jgi:hypothetical protein
MFVSRVSSDLQWDIEIPDLGNVAVDTGNAVDQRMPSKGNSLILDRANIL